MRHIFVTDDDSQLILIPESEMDRLLLDNIISPNGTTEIEWIRQPVSVLGISVKDSIVIRKKSYKTITEDANQA
jgi:hypothetical protein